MSRFQSSSAQSRTEAKLNQRSWSFFYSFIHSFIHSSEKLVENNNNNNNNNTTTVLKAFILRARVLKLYRQSLRIARRAPGHSKDDLRNEIRQEVEKNRDCNDKQRIRFLISEGLERLKSLDEMLDMQGH